MIKVTVNNEIQTMSYEDSKDLEKELGNHFEYVYPVRLSPSFVMVVDENSYLKNLDINMIGSYYYASDKNGHAILGDILILRIQREYDGYTFTDLAEQEEKELIEEIKMITKNYVVSLTK